MEFRSPIADTEFSNTFFWEKVPSGSWEGKPCYIIGGGPSLEKHWAWLIPRLQDQLTIGINCAYEKIEPTIAFGMDPKFIRWIQMGKYGEPAREKWEHLGSYKVWLCTYTTKLPDDVYILKCLGGYVAARHVFPFRMENGIGHGNNSGYAALNLAACLGANPIYLLGFDMKREGTKTNWHAGHPEKMRDSAPASFIKHFAIAAKELDKKGIKVINLNPKSALTCFPKAELTEGFGKPPPRIEHVKRPHVSREEAKFGPILNVPPKEPAKEATKTPLFITGPYGYGDTIYLRSVVKSFAKHYSPIYLRTTLPEAFWDIKDVEFVRPIPNKLHSQSDHIAMLDKAEDHKWSTPPKDVNHMSWSSFVPGWRHQEDSTQAITINPRGEESTTKFFVNQFGIDDFDFSFALKSEWLTAALQLIKSLRIKNKRLCIVRPPTIHKGWACYTRNPKPEYMQLLIDKYKDEYFFITIADNKKGSEWFEGGALKGINKRFDHGELPITTVFGLIKYADMIITPPDLFSVLAIATRTKCFCIFGGCAKPSVIFDENMGLENLECATPDPFCNCMRMEHDCNKEIPEEVLLQKFESLRTKIKKTKRTIVGLPPGIGDMHWVLTKLESFKHKNCIDELHVVIDRNPSLSYSREFLQLVPFIDSVDDNQRHLPFKFSIAGGDGTPLQKNINGVDYLIELNSRLEQGTRIEDVLPEYDVDFDYPIDYPDEAKSFTKLIKEGMGGKLYLFYTSSIAGNRNWCKGTWEPRDWVRLAEIIHDETGNRILLMGAQWDAGYSHIIKTIDRRDVIQNFAGKTNIAEALGLLRESNFLVGFLSGLVILATRFRIPCVSFWPTLKQAPHWGQHQCFPEKFQKSWIPPHAEEDGYMPVFYGHKDTTPQAIFERLRKYL